jgi:uncharacterized membrane protein
MTDTNREEHWRRTKSLMIVTLTIWFIFSLWPLGFYMAAQGSEVVFVLTLFWFVRTQDKIDRDCGLAEED